MSALRSKRLVVVDDTPPDLEQLHAQNQATAIAMIIAPEEGRLTEEQIRERLAPAPARDRAASGGVVSAAENRERVSVALFGKPAPTGDVTRGILGLTCSVIDAERARIIDALRASDGIGSAAEAVAVVEALGGYGAEAVKSRVCTECGKDMPEWFANMPMMTSCSLECADVIARRYIKEYGR